MVEALKLDLISPEKLILSEDVDMVVLPGGEGDFGVMRGHSPVISTLRPGEIIIFEKNKAGWIGDIPVFSYDTQKAREAGWEPTMSSTKAIEKAIKEIYYQLN